MNNYDYAYSIVDFNKLIWTIKKSTGKRTREQTLCVLSYWNIRRT